MKENSFLPIFTASYVCLPPPSFPLSLPPSRPTPPSSPPEHLREDAADTPDVDLVEEVLEVLVRESLGGADDTVEVALHQVRYDVHVLAHTDRHNAHTDRQSLRLYMFTSRERW